jgi:AraC-like DNA-binding protein
LTRANEEEQTELSLVGSHLLGEKDGVDSFAWTRALFAPYRAIVGRRGKTPVTPSILCINVDKPTGAVFAVTVERFARILPVASVVEGVRRLSESPFGLVILEQTQEDGNVGALLRVAKARRCSVLVIAEPSRIPFAFDQFDGWRLALWPITIQALIEGAGNALAADRHRPPELPRFGRPVSQAIEYIRLNYHAQLTVTAIANAIHVSPSHLAHRFRSETGMTVKDYVNRVRVEIARRLLLETDAKLESIADAVGFYDAPHLSRVFVQYTRTRPGEYRRRPA